MDHRGDAGKRRFWRLDAGLEGRIVTVALLSTITALIAAFALYQWRNYSSDRADLAHESIQLANAIGAAAHRQVTAGDPGVTTAAGALLRSNKHALAAAYVDEAGRSVTYSRDGVIAPQARWEALDAPVTHFGEKGLEVRAPYVADGPRVGEVVLLVDDRSLITGRVINIAIALALSLAATIASGLIARRLARQALAPLRALDETMAAVTASRDFRTRLPVARDDEVGRLTERFNKLQSALGDYDESLRGALIEATAARDAAERANALKSQFLSNMSHELRTPLNGVLGMSQVLLREKLTPSQREGLGVIHKSGSALLTVLNDVLELAEIEAGTMRLDIAPAALEDVVEEACETAITLAESKGLRLDVELDAAARGHWRCDAKRLRQVLYNLISNGLKFTSVGGVKVSATADAGMLTISVADTGVGIAADALPHLFDKFTQADGGTTRRFGGAGIGLAICRSLVELMDGELSVDSRPGHGSTFVIRLPLERAEAAAAGGGATTLDGMRVLIAEDNETNQRVVCTVLAALGVEPTVVADGRAAVEAWSGGQWDLVLMDIQMPVADGVTATREIRRLEAERGLAPTRIVALTANALPEQVDTYFDAGMDGVVRKPIMIDQLHAALTEARSQLAA